MSGPFDYFVVFAEMRTGSNFLESNLNAFDSFQCHGEAFNPHFIGYPNKTEILGVTQDMRDADPARLVNTIKEQSEGLGGFRFFNDHDQRVLDLCLDDPRCAKIILTRNPVDSYVSWKIAQATGQWKLTNVKRRKDSKVAFDGPEFEKHVARLQEFQVMLLNRLQTTGQTAFYVAYEDLQNLDVVNGLAKFLGSDERLEALDASLKKQNPSSLEDKVSNFDEMERALSGLDPFNLTRTPNFEPRRGPGVPGYVTGAKAPILYMPMRAGPEEEVRAWLAALDGVPSETLPTKMQQKGLRQWKRRNRRHRSFTVLRHPLARAHHVFCTRILMRGPGTFSDIRKTLRNFHKLPIPGGNPDDTYDRRAHRAAFGAFLEFLKANLAGQTGIRIDAHWATQSSVMQGMGEFALPDMVIREDEMETLLPVLAKQVGYAKPPRPAKAQADVPFALSEIYDDDLEDLARAVYQRDYMMFGFGKWGD
ncbi:sulfotransferase domain-containing protein [Roseovarius sp. A21]|uniref:Sulfotransferase domain-containing protein n=1 Tax=Roseovarius bejariae TaxID=2576383 RepID=A0A844CQ66_9RHOB|nr:nodulation protein NodH [Roseovarius bejariae]MRU15615.1 sulfotransferase domain-containing protein [Roseovarius bejariae]